MPDQDPQAAVETTSNLANPDNPIAGQVNAAAAQPSNMPAPTSPGQPVPPSDTAGANAQPATTRPVPASPASASAPADHGTMFKSILSTLAGGGQVPVKDAQGNYVTDANGKVQTRQAGVKQLGAGILAGALASLMAGFQHLPTVDANGRVESHLNEAAQAGAQAGAANTNQARVAQAQKMSDADKTRAYQTMDNNLKLHAAAVTAANLDNDARAKMVANGKPLWDDSPSPLHRPILCLHSSKKSSDSPRILRP
jgi:hypothetical protein